MGLFRSTRERDNMVTPLVKHKIVKKRTLKFKRFQSDRKVTVKESWRKPRGIDGRFRRKFKGLPPHPNVAGLDLLLMHNRKYCAEVAHNVSAQNRKAIVERAQQLNVNVINKSAKLRSEEDE